MAAADGRTESAADAAGLGAAALSVAGTRPVKQLPRKRSRAGGASARIAARRACGTSGVCHTSEPPVAWNMRSEPASVAHAIMPPPAPNAIVVRREPRRGTNRRCSLASCHTTSTPSSPPVHTASAPRASTTSTQCTGRECQWRTDANGRSRCASRTTTRRPRASPTHTESELHAARHVAEPPMSWRSSVADGSAYTSR